MIELHNWGIEFCGAMSIPSNLMGLVLPDDCECDDDDDETPIFIDKVIVSLDLEKGVVTTTDDLIFKLTGDGRKIITSDPLTLKEFRESFFFSDY